MMPGFIPPLLVDLLRHGHVAGEPCFRGITDDPLSDEGWRVMTLATQKSLRADRVITSPLRRCHDFSLWWSEQYQRPIAVDEGFREYDFGLWDGLTAQQVMALDPQKLTAFWQDPTTHPPPGAESMAGFQTRILQSLQRLFLQPEAAHILVVTHGGVMRQIAALLLEKSFQEMWNLDIPLGGLLRLLLWPATQASRPHATFMGFV